MKIYRRSISVFLVLLFVPVIAQGQHVLENPPPNSYQSGIGVISGWICNGVNPAVRFNRGAPISVAYGTTRRDTASVCRDDGNNGFSLLWNWNLLGDGTHLVELLNGGQVIASATVHVTTFGTEFLRGAGGSLSGVFGGRQVTVEWSEAAQNFVITRVEGGGTIPNVAGTWQARMNFFTEDCNFLSVPPDLPTSIVGTFTISQNGNRLVGRAGTLSISGEVKPNGDFTLLTEPDIEVLSSTCTVAFVSGYAGNFLSGLVVFVMTVDKISGSCLGLSLPCSVAYAGTLVKVSGQLDDEAFTTGDLYYMLKDAISR